MLPLKITRLSGGYKTQKLIFHRFMIFSISSLTMCRSSDTQICIIYSFTKSTRNCATNNNVKVYSFVDFLFFWISFVGYETIWITRLAKRVIIFYLFSILPRHALTRSNPKLTLKNYSVPCPALRISYGPFN